MNGVIKNFEKNVISVKNIIEFRFEFVKGEFLFYVLLTVSSTYFIQSTQNCSMYNHVKTSLIFNTRFNNDVIIRPNTHNPMSHTLIESAVQCTYKIDQYRREYSTEYKVLKIRI